jgi:CDP-glucose 4,6-dehydratase
LCDKWGSNNGFRVEKNEDSPHEAKYLKLDCSKASTLLGWNPKWSLDTALDKIVYWNKQFAQNPDDIVDVTLKQINEFNNGIL